VTGDLAAVGARYRAARHRIGVSQDTAARLAEVTVDTVSAFEHGRRDIPIGTLRALCDAIWLPVADVLAPKSTPWRSRP
jgi:transcriptional regulator with XRE-family HTH domain